MKKVFIVIEETGAKQANGDQAFNIYLSGDTDRIGKVSTNELTAAEYYGSTLFKICMEALTKAGVVKTVKERGKLQ